MSLYRTKVRQGELEGTDQGFYAVYKGIPYAPPPIGSLRFCAPGPPVNWEGKRAARENPPVPWQSLWQRDAFYEKEFYRGDKSLERRSEDCLYLNIWTPAKTKEDKLPVLFWIHGGAFRQGFGHEREFDGEEYCRRGVILVTIQYRLGVFGFLAHPWLEDGGGNLALQDQIAALNWVYGNIHSFGGDPEKITVAGQSAGAVSVQALLCAEEARDMIRHAILQSGGGFGQLSRRCRSKREMLKAGTDFLEKCGIRDPGELKEMEAGKLLQMALRENLPCHFIAAEADGASPRREEPGAARGEGDPISRGLQLSPEAVLYETAGREIPCLLGSNRNDIRVTSQMLARGTSSDLYVGNVEFARHFGKNGRCYLYFFERCLPGDEAGAFHSAELWYMFGTLGRSWRPFSEEDYRLSEKMLDAWACFVREGHPGEEDWTAYRDTQPCIRIYG